MSNFWKYLDDVNKTEKIIKEEQYKHLVYSKLLTYLGYSVDEIKFEVPINSRIEGQNQSINKGVEKADIICRDILFEIKSSNIKLDDRKVFNQVLNYNKYLNKKIVCIANFKKMKIYNSDNEFLVELDFFENNRADLECIMYLLLAKYSLFRGKSYEDFEEMDRQYKNFFELKKNYYKIIEIFNEGKKIYFENDLNVYPLSDKNLNKIYLEFKNDIEIEIWLEPVINKFSLLSFSCDVIDENVKKITSILKDILNNDFQFKIFVENFSYVAKDSWIKNPTNKEKIEFKYHIQEKFEKVDKIIKEIEKNSLEIEKLNTILLDYYNINF